MESVQPWLWRSELNKKIQKKKKNHVKRFRLCCFFYTNNEASCKKLRGLCCYYFTKFGQRACVIILWVSKSENALTFHSNPPTAIPPAAAWPAKPMNKLLPTLLDIREAPIYKTHKDNLEYKILKKNLPYVCRMCRSTVLCSPATTVQALCPCKHEYIIFVAFSYMNAIWM